MKRRTAVIAAALVLALLAAAYWYGGDAPGLQGWGVGEASSQTGNGSEGGPEEDASAPEAPSPWEERPDPENVPTQSAPDPQDPETPQSSSASGGTQPEGDNAASSQSNPAQPADDPEPVPPQQAQEGEEGQAEQEANCRISIRCATVLNHLDWLDPDKVELIPADGVLLGEREVELEEGESAFSLLQRVTRAEGIHLEASFTPGTGSAYVEGIGNLYEFDCGQQSGWLYLVNGVSPGCSCSEYLLQPGDRVEWAYTCNMGADVGAASVGG